jgi:hypothetical protein
LYSLKSGDNQSDISTKNPTEEVFAKHSTDIVSEKDDSIEAGDKINFAFVSQTYPKIMYGEDPYMQYLQKWEAEYLINTKSKDNKSDINVDQTTNAQHAADLIRKLQGWEAGLEPFTDHDLEEIRNSELLIKQLDVADAFKDYVWEDKLD